MAVTIAAVATTAEVACLERASFADEAAQEGFAVDAADYLDLATAAAATVRPSLIAMSGLSGTGKSTVAAALGRSLGVPILASEVVRKEQRNGAVLPRRRGARLVRSRADRGDVRASLEACHADAGRQPRGHSRRYLPRREAAGAARRRSTGGGGAARPRGDRLRRGYGRRSDPPPAPGAATHARTPPSKSTGASARLPRPRRPPYRAAPSASSWIPTLIVRFTSTPCSRPCSGRPSSPPGFRARRALPTTRYAEGPLLAADTFATAGYPQRLRVSYSAYRPSLPTTLPGSARAARRHDKEPRRATLSNRGHVPNLRS
jgi:hypothetical protein